MVKTRRGDNSLLDESFPGVNENASDEEEKESMPKRRSLRSRDPDADHPKKDEASSDDDDTPLFNQPTRKSLRSHKVQRNSRVSRRGSNHFTYNDPSSNDESDEDAPCLKNGAEDSSPSIKTRARRRTRKICSYSSAEEDEELLRRSRRYRPHRYQANSSFASRSLSGVDAGPRRSSRKRTVRYSYNDWIHEEQAHSSYMHYRSRKARRDSVSAPQYSLRRHSNVGKEADQEESHAEEQSRPRRSTRVKLEHHDSDEEKQEEIEQAEEDDDTKANKDLEDTDHAEKSQVPQEDMYTRVKRNRRIRQNIGFNDSANAARNSKMISSGDESGSSEANRPPSPRKGYHLRQRRPLPPMFQHGEPLRSSKRNFQNNRSRYRQSSSSSSSSSDYEKKRDKKNRGHLSVGHANSNLKRKNRSNLADTDPMEINPDIKFSDVGGLSEIIDSLKEMIVFPIMYSEVFEKFHITPPKGVLFHGPPGTGKTLMAKALVNECSIGTQKFSFFMRKGADCLSKWVGESERQLRLLFEQAYQMRPSIIFFDELDGLAPVRSCKQDQIHASIVSTLLALMDGLKDRRDIIIIGATNRIDAIDPALRRPGRFDREMFFPLPAVKEREEILKIHVSKWDEQPTPELLSEMAELSDGYCGADLRSLCSEAVLQSLRRRYPQIYHSSAKLLLDTNQVQVCRSDFLTAKAQIVPASYRMSKSFGKRLPQFVAPLVQAEVERAVTTLAKQFPHVNETSTIKCKQMPAAVPSARLLLCGSSKQAQTTLVAPALLLRLEHASVHSLEISALHGTPGVSPEEVCMQVFREAVRQIPSVIYVPNVDRWWNLVSDTIRDIFLDKLALLELNAAVLLLATANTPYNSSEMPQELKRVFCQYRGEVFCSTNPSRVERLAFFSPLILEKPFETKTSDMDKELALEVLPLAPPPAPRKLTEKEEKALVHTEEISLRELRIFLRQTLDKLSRNKKFAIFVDPVDQEDAPDYYSIIKNPMDLSTMYEKVNKYEYNCAADFLVDINLICENCLEYNPDRQLRTTACNFRDSVHALIKAEMDTDFEDNCKKISESRKVRKFDSKPYLMDFIHVAPPVVEQKENDHETDADDTTNLVNGDADTSLAGGAANSSACSMNTESKQKKRKSRWSSGIISRPKKKKALEKADESSSSKMDTTLDVESSPSKSPVPSTSDVPEVLQVARDLMDSMLDSAESIVKEVVKLPNKEHLSRILEKAVKMTEGMPHAVLLDLYSVLSQTVVSFAHTSDKSLLHEKLADQLTKFRNECIAKFERS